MRCKPLRHSGARRDPARRDAGAAGAPSRPRAGAASTPISRRGSTRFADMAARHLDLDAILAMAAPLAGARRAGAATLKPPGQRIALALGRGVFVCLCPCARRLAARPAQRSCRSRRCATRRRRTTATSAGCRAAIPSCTPDSLRRRAAFCDGLAKFAQTPSGARRVRRLHGAGRRPRGRPGRSPCDGGPARPRHKLRQAQAPSRLSAGAPAGRQSDRRGGRRRARPRIPPRLDHRARATTSRSSRSPTRRAGR